MLGLPLSTPTQVRLIVSLTLGLLSFKFLPATLKSLTPRTTISQLGRQLITTPLAEQFVLTCIDLGGLAQHPVDFLTDRLIRAGSFPRRVRGDRGPIQSDDADRHQPGPCAPPKDLREQRAKRGFVTCAEPRDRAVIRDPVGADHSSRNVFCTAPLDRP